jgi:hypothetical protein
MVCIFCKLETDPTEEHVIAEALGGADETIWDVCKECNDKLGWDVDVLADHDAMLTTARRQAGLRTRHASVRATAPVSASRGKLCGPSSRATGTIR